MSEKLLNKADLAQFYGSEEWYRHALARNILYTEGVQYVAEYGGAYWLIDEIVFAQKLPAVAAEEFQVWHLAVNEDNSAVLTCDDGNNLVVYSKKIIFTDFPLSEIRFYFSNNVIHLPSEN